MAMTTSNSTRVNAMRLRETDVGVGGATWPTSLWQICEEASMTRKRSGCGFAIGLLLSAGGIVAAPADFGNTRYLTPRACRTDNPVRPKYRCLSARHAPRHSLNDRAQPKQRASVVLVAQDFWLLKISRVEVPRGPSSGLGDS